MLISFHTPKAGGSSFKELLKAHFKGRFLADYYDKPINKQFSERVANTEKSRRNIELYKKYLFKILGIQCIHGHFLPYKYDQVLDDKDTKFVTWLRDPIERIGSHYHFWKRYSYQGRLPPLRRRVVQENWSLERFCFSEEMQNIYSKFLWNFPLSNFDFIGITEHYNCDVKYFASEFLNLDKFTIPHVNKNPSQPKSYFNDVGMIKELREHHSEDYEIYNYALQKREERLLESKDSSEMT